MVELGQTASRREKLVSAKFCLEIESERCANFSEIALKNCVSVSHATQKL